MSAYLGNLPQNLNASALAKAQAERTASAESEYNKILAPDETDYDTHVTIIGKKFEEDFRPILRFTQVVYICMIFETFVQQHVDEIEREFGRPTEALFKLKEKMQCGLTEAARAYFGQIRWSVLNEQQWEFLETIAAVRNRIVHNSGVVCGSKWATEIYGLASAGIEIDLLKNKDFGQPLIVQKKFLTCCLDILDKFFNAVTEKSHAEFWPPPTKASTGTIVKK